MKVKTNHVPQLRAPMSEEDLAALRERNAARIAAAIKALGSNWLGWCREHEKPDTQESYQQDQINEHTTRRIPGCY